MAISLGPAATESGVKGYCVLSESFNLFFEPGLSTRLRTPIPYACIIQYKVIMWHTYSVVSRGSQLTIFSRWLSYSRRSSKAHAYMNLNDGFFYSAGLQSVKSLGMPRKHFNRKVNPLGMSPHTPNPKHPILNPLGMSPQTPNPK